jgi:glycosyltransferase involved in cell wall biosynthesis
MQDENIKYSIVVPFYNEQENVRPLYQKIKKVMDGLGEPYEIVFIDDGSKDRTFALLDEIYAADERVHVIRLKRNFGQAAALAAGFDFARGEIIIPMDGDLQHDPEDIPRLLEKLADGYDIVSGWRKDRVDNLLTRRLPSRIANWMIAKLSGVPLHDFGTTFKAYKREVIKNINLYGELHRFIPALASWWGASVVEVPIRNTIRTSGRSKYGLSRTFRVLLDMLTVKFLLSYSARPLHFFGIFGLAGIASGGAIGLFLLYKKLFRGTHLLTEHGPLFLLAILLILVGTQFLSLGLVCEMVSRVYYETQRKPIYGIGEIRTRRKV